MRRVMSEMHRELIGTELQRMTPVLYAERWLATRKNEIADASYKIYKHVLDGFIASLGERAKLDMHVLCREDILTWRDALGAERSARTANNRMKILRIWLKSARIDRWMHDIIAEGIKPLKQRAEKNVKQPFTVPELRLILSKASEEWKAMIIRGYYTGQRLGDIARLKVGDEDPHAGQVTMITGKTGRRVIIDMHPAYIDFVLSEKTSDDPAAPLHPKAMASVIENNGRVVTLSQQFAELLIECGLRTTKAGTAATKTFYPLSFHSLRHTFVSHLQDAGVSRSVVQDIVGHDSAAVNVSYTHLDRATKTAAVGKLPDIITKI